MVNKLLIVRVDNFTVQKFNLLIGDNIIGRGAVTGHVDNPIAEQAVVINLAPTGEMSITPMLACYMKSTCSNRWQSLKIGSTVAIRSGDICSLLPDKSWFKITSSDSSVMDENDINGKRKSEKPSEEEPSNKKIRSENSVETIYSQINDVLDTWDTISERVDVNSHSDSANNEHDDPCADENNHSLGVRNQNSSVEVIPSDSDNTGNAAATVPAEVSTSSPGKTTAEESTDSANTKETSSGENREDAEKKIKWDCGRHFSDQTEQRTSKTTADLEEGSASASNDPSAAPEAATPTEKPLRNKCTYGSQCYRRNSEHRARFSHPGDPDYDTPDPRPECPYGIRCYRKNPQHKRDFKHTKNRRSRAQTPVRVRASDEPSETENSSAEESVDESEYEPSQYDGTSDDYLSEYDDRSDFEDFDSKKTF